MKEFFIVLVVLFIVVRLLRRRRRRAKRLARQLFFQQGGQYHSGGIFGTPTIETRFGPHHFSIAIEPRKGGDGPFNIYLMAPWNPARCQLSPQAPTQLSSTPGLASRCSQTLLSSAHALEQLPGTTLQQVWTTEHHFRITAVLNSANVEHAMAWVKQVAQLYLNLLADTEQGIAFSNAAQKNLDDINCQVCGVPADSQDRVVCAKCGSPHHAECWEYNRGCAIYGCKCKSCVREGMIV